MFTDEERLQRLINIALDSFWPLVEAALLFTLPLAIISFILGIIVALFTALARLSNNRILNGIANFYVWIIRGTPLLVQLFILFYGLGSIGIIIDPFPAAVIGFTLNVGAYSSEVIRAAIISIPKGQWEAAYSIGMSYRQALRRIVIPQATRVSIPPLSNSFIGLVKDTSLAAVITVVEVFRVAQQIAATNYEPMVLYVEVAIIYLIICTILSIGQSKLEKRFDRYSA